MHVVSVSPDWVPLPGTLGAVQYPPSGVVPGQLPWMLQHLQVALPGPWGMSTICFWMQLKPLASQAVCTGRAVSGALFRSEALSRVRCWAGKVSQGEKEPEVRACTERPGSKYVAMLNLVKPPDFLEPQCHPL